MVLQSDFQSDFLEGLNDSQREAVLATEGAVRVVAGPGTGKTRTLTSRYCHLVANLGIAPANILAVTFTNKAADEMKSRVRKALGDADLGVISTIHSFCRLLLRDEIHILSFPQTFIILDTLDQRTILREIFKEFNLSSKDMTIKEALDNILEARKMHVGSYIKYFLEFNNERIKEGYLNPEKTLEDRIFLRYLYEQKKNFALDFNDLINFAAYILKRYEDVRTRWQEKIQYVMIDEFQDVSKKQYDIGRILSAYHKNIFVVGDSDQTIYSWRDAHYRLFLDFQDHYEGSKTIILSENYRSTPEILKLADASVKNNTVRFSKILTPTIPSGMRPVFYFASESEGEGEWIAKKVGEIVKVNPSLKDIAILCRSHLLSKNIELALFNAGIPFRHINGRAFFSRKEIKDALSYLRMLTKADDLSFSRTINVPPRAFGKKTLSVLKEFSESHNISLYESLKVLIQRDRTLRKKAQGYVHAIETIKGKLKDSSPDDLFQELLDQTGFEEMIRLSGDEERLDSLAELKRNLSDFVKDPENTLSDFLDKAALTMASDHERTEDFVSIMTVHTAKGLEFQTVFVCGLNEGVFPSRRVENLAEMEEERRIFYVAVTRAKENLFLTGAEGYVVEGGSATKTPSRFLSETAEFIDGARERDADLLKGKNQKRQNPPAIEEESLFKPGDSVNHFAFGIGLVLDVNRSENSYLIKFASLSTPRSITFGAKLEPA
jgi:DNA helicase-2/ATP-dependent DNA helicase PcrA